jgi:hypothetical protein
MILPTIFITLYLITTVLFSIRSCCTAKTHKVLVIIHLASLTLLFVEWLLVKTFRGVWFDRLLVISFLTTASAVFAISRRRLPLWQKTYFGLFFFYPLIAAISFFLDRIMFVIVASPLILSLTLPEIRYSDKVYEIRESVGPMAPMQLMLLKKGLLTEEVIGICNNEDVVHLKISSLKIVSETKDSINSIFISKDKMIKATFTK